MVLYTGAPIRHSVDPVFLFTPSLSLQMPGSEGYLSGASPYTLHMVLYTGAAFSHSVNPAFLFTPSLSLQMPGSAGFLRSNGMDRNAEFT
ncbi:hypothetical protein XELAEV_18001113mg [Xenopus laevis]|uniref:Uncharacterized protein n=1 Tax=Xenopus laevis TaxID=8355 RepID=A0A974BPL2_XENLA|nr:hypothetical protein XELAEV_18001113mg [Xenopus laevis]